MTFICFLSFVTTDGEDGNGLKLENVRPTFQVLMLLQQKNIKKLILGYFFKNISLDIHLKVCRELFILK